MEMLEIAEVFANHFTQGEVHVVSKKFETQKQHKTENGVNVIMSKDLPNYSRGVIALIIDNDIDVPPEYILERVVPTWCFLEREHPAIKEIKSKSNTRSMLDYYYAMMEFPDSLWLVSK